MTHAATVRDRDLSSDNLAHVFKARLEFTSDSPSDAVVPAEGRDGAYIGSGHATVTGDRVEGTMSWSLYAGIASIHASAKVRPFPTISTCAR
jgi:hypothetical protein